jgi:hypothetical protein
VKPSSCVAMCLARLSPASGCRNVLSGTALTARLDAIDRRGRRARGSAGT